jgi:hypothetical protein
VQRQEPFKIKDASNFAVKVQSAFALNKKCVPENKFRNALAPYG